MKKFTFIFFAFCLFTFTLQSQWFQLPNLPVSGTVYDMYFVNANTGWITFNTMGTILKTTNGGQSWVQQFTPASEVYDIQFFNDTLGIALSYLSGNRLILSTTNGGNSWNQIYSTGNPLFNINFVNKDTGWVCGTDGFLGGVWQTTDGGVSFHRQLTSTAGSLTRIFFLKERINSEYVGWTVNMPMVYKTTNSGMNWILIYIGSGTFCDGTSTSDLYFRDSLNGITTRGGDCFNITTNGGFNWTLINEHNATGGKIAMGNNQIGWMSLATDSVIKTTNFFQTYGRQYIPVVAVKPIFAIDTSVVYAALNQNAVIKTTNGGGPISEVNIISGEVPKEFKLYQNYPNPFNPVTKIKYQISKSCYVKLVIYDMLGREAAVLVNQKQTPGIYQAEWTPGELSSGVYFYTLQAENFRDSKKLVYVM